MSARSPCCPVRRHDARHQLRRAAAGSSAICRFGAIVGIILVVELIIVSVAGAWASLVSTIAAPTPAIADVSNTQALGMLLYTSISTVPIGGMVLLCDDRTPSATHRERRRRQAPEDRRPVDRTRATVENQERAERERHLTCGKRPPRTISTWAILFTIGFSAFSQPEERHHHSDVGRADAALGQPQPGRVLALPERHVGRSFAMLVLTVAAAEAAIGLAILVVYFRNRARSRLRTST